MNQAPSQETATLTAQAPLPERSAHLREARVTYRYNRRFKSPVGTLIGNSREVYVLFSHLSRSDRESMYVLHLDTRNRVLSVEHAATGIENKCTVSASTILRTALLVGAQSLILVHNHPSGDPSPSKEDKSLTVEIAKAAALLGIVVLDHVVIGDGRYFSLADEGIITKPVRI